MVETADGDPLLAAWSTGDERARSRLLEIFYPELQRAAAGMLRNERQVSLSSGDLVQEAVLKLIQLRQIAYEDRAHFMAMASRFMRRTLIDYARAKHADKREHQRVTLHTNFEARQPVDLSTLEHALKRLGGLDRERAEIVEMRYYGGMSLNDIASVLSLSEATVKRRWCAARAWLIDAMENPFAAIRPDA